MKARRVNCSPSMRAPVPIAVIAITAFCLGTIAYGQDLYGFLVTVVLSPIVSVGLYFLWARYYKDSVAALVAAWLFQIVTALFEPVLYGVPPSVADLVYVLIVLSLAVRDVQFRQHYSARFLVAGLLAAIHVILTNGRHWSFSLCGLALVVVAPVGIARAAQLRQDLIAPIKTINRRTAQTIGSFFIVLSLMIVAFGALNLSTYLLYPGQYALKDSGSAIAGFDKSRYTTACTFLFEAMAITFNQSHTQLKPVGLIALSLSFLQAILTWVIFSIYLKFLLTEPKPPPNNE